MEHAARNRIIPRDRDPAPWVMPTVTVIAFGGAFALYRFGLLGVLTSGALLMGWVAFVLGVALRQHRRDIASGKIIDAPSRKPSRLARALQLLFLIAAGACLAWGAWLQRQGAPLAVAGRWSDGAVLFCLLAGLFSLVTDAIELALNRFLKRRRV